MKKDGEDGYTFTFTLPKSYMGQKVAFVPGKPNGSWYEGKNFTQQYYMTIPKVSEDNKLIDDGKYETSIESDFSMFKITSQSATVKGGVVTVTIGTSKNTYDKFHFGTGRNNRYHQFSRCCGTVKTFLYADEVNTVVLHKLQIFESVSGISGESGEFEHKNITNRVFVRFDGFNHPHKFGTFIALAGFSLVAELANNLNAS